MLIARLKSCFRYQDHTLEEYRKALDVLSPGLQGGLYCGARKDDRMRIMVQNPTAESVRCQVVLRGNYHVRQAPSCAP